MCFFKQKTAYEIEYGLVGSEMCIRDRVEPGRCGVAGVDAEVDAGHSFARQLADDLVHDPATPPLALEPGKEVCLLYTSPSPRDRTRSRMPSSA